MLYVRQQDMDTAVLRGSGCGPTTAINALIHASRGGWRPKDQSDAARYRIDRSGVTRAEFRARGLTPDELYRSLDAVKASEVRMDIPVKAYHGVLVRSVLLPRIRDTKGCAAVAVRNKVLADAGRSPFPTFRTGHWGLVTEWHPADDEVSFVDAGRRRAIRLSVDLLVEAMEQFGKNPWGRGRGEAILVWPWQTWRTGYAVVRAQLAACEAGK